MRHRALCFVLEHRAGRHICHGAQVERKNFVLRYDNLNGSSSLSGIIRKMPDRQVYLLGAQSHVLVSAEVLYTPPRLHYCGEPPRNESPTTATHSRCCYALNLHHTGPHHSRAVGDATGITNSKFSKRSMRAELGRTPRKLKGLASGRSVQGMVGWSGIEFVRRYH